MANTFGTDILIQAADPMEAANFYVEELEVPTADRAACRGHGPDSSAFGSL